MISARAAGQRPAQTASGPGGAQPWRARLRLARLHLMSRRVPAAVAVVTACAAALRIALIWHWDAYGALQLPLVCEVLAAAAVAVAAASPFGEPERVAGRQLPVLRLATAVALSALAVGALAAAGSGAHLSGGTLDVLRNVAGITGLGLVWAAVLGAGLAWVGPTAYLVAGVYALYTQWHGPAITTPWIWPARPQDDVGAALCAALVFSAGLVFATVRGARDLSAEAE
jgi:hypothetical protein